MIETHRSWLRRLENDESLDYTVTRSGGLQLHGPETAWDWWRRWIPLFAVPVLLLGVWDLRLACVGLAAVVGLWLLAVCSKPGYRRARAGVPGAECEDQQEIEYFLRSLSGSDRRRAALILWKFYRHKCERLECHGSLFDEHELRQEWQQLVCEVLEPSKTITATPLIRGNLKLPWELDRRVDGLSVELARLAGRGLSTRDQVEVESVQQSIRESVEEYARMRGSRRQQEGQEVLERVLVSCEERLGKVEDRLDDSSLARLQAEERFMQGGRGTELDLS